jgi:hypothetical protein
MNISNNLYLFKCATQWFHFVCVGLNAAPKGKWFCPSCVEIKKKRRERHLNVIMQHNANLPSLAGPASNLVASSSSDQQQNATSNVNMFISPSNL